MYMRKLTKQVVTDFTDPVVSTKAGKLRGAKVEGTYIFRGVKYADAERFHMPKPVQPWEGIKPALDFGHVCPEINTPIPHDEFYVPHFFYPQNENCQYLNVWTQHINDGAKRPVLVWFHGGGWFSGSSVELFSYDGENLSAYGDVVVVSVNHRLNVLGYLDLSAYGEEYKYSANVGLADLVASLQWVKENIAAFGGDPDDVMLFGQSGGGAKVLSMLQTPAADGLYKRIVMQSGGARGKHDADPKQAKADAQWFAAKVLERLKLDPKDVKKIETVPWYDLAQAAAEATWIYAREHGGRVNYGPQTDFDYYYGHPGAHGFREETKNVGISCGTVLGEFSNNYNIQIGEGHKNYWSEEYKAQLFKEQYGENAEKYVEAFKAAYPEKNTADLLYFAKEGRLNAIEFCRMRAAMEGAAPCYNWLFNLEAPFMDGTIAWHNAEEPYVFHNAQYIEAQYEPDVSEKLQDIMSTAWINFAATGDPNHAGMPQWDAVSADSCPTMIFDRECVQRVDHDTELCSWFRTPPKKTNSFPGSGIMAGIFGLEPKDD